MISFQAMDSFANRSNGFTASAWLRRSCLDAAHPTDGRTPTGVPGAPRAPRPPPDSPPHPASRRGRDTRRRKISTRRETSTCTERTSMRIIVYSLSSQQGSTSIRRLLRANSGLYNQSNGGGNVLFHFL